MKTGSVLAGLMMASALLIGGCGQSTEPPKDQMKKPAEVPATAPGAPTATEPPPPGGAMAPAGTAPAGMVKGELLRIEGDFYVVKDDTGKEVRLHVDKTSKVDGSPKAGDKVEAQVTAEGHAASLKKQ
jgi:hypothetical protein